MMLMAKTWGGDHQSNSNAYTKSISIFYTTETDVEWLMEWSVTVPISKS